MLSQHCLCLACPGSTQMLHTEQVGHAREGCAHMAQARHGQPSANPDASTDTTYVFTCSCLIVSASEVPVFFSPGTEM